MIGFLLIDKPIGITSHDVVDRIRRITGEQRVGHAGTLDPLASGLLIIGVGRDATKHMQELSGLDKEYLATFVLGASSETDDAEGKIQSFPPKTITEAELKSAISKLTGHLEQMPPRFSAKKVHGQKSYEAARLGQTLEIKPSHITVYKMDLLPFPSNTIHTTCFPLTTPFRLDVLITCSTGTYIRALARDLGQLLGTGGYVEKLRRTKIGNFKIEQALLLDNLLPDLTTTLIPVHKIVPMR